MDRQAFQSAVMEKLSSLETKVEHLSWLLSHESRLRAIESHMFHAKSARA